MGSEVTGMDKWYISFQAAALFALIASPAAYRVTGMLHETAPWGMQHLLLHAFIYLCVVRFMMGNGNDAPRPTKLEAGGGGQAEQRVAREQEQLGFPAEYYVK